jgi:hypothetical protein
MPGVGDDAASCSWVKALLAASSRVVVRWVAADSRMLPICCRMFVYSPCTTPCEYTDIRITAMTAYNRQYVSAVMVEQGIKPQYSKDLTATSRTRVALLQLSETPNYISIGADLIRWPNPRSL